MRMSCNGCRVLRKGCSDNCAIRPCLQWIRSPDAQANATVFLAKFYGRAGLLNLITAGPDPLRPAIFRSLLYEACGRMLNPVYGSVGLLWSGNWQLCQSAVESVLRGAPILQAPTAATAVPPLRTCDIHHVAKSGGSLKQGAAAADLHRPAEKSRARFKRPGAASRSPAGLESGIELMFAEHAGELHDVRCTEPLKWARREPSHESASHGEVRENDSYVSADTIDGSDVSQTEPGAVGADSCNAGLDLTLGLPPPVCKTEPEDHDSRLDQTEPRGGGCTVKLGLAISA